MAEAPPDPVSAAQRSQQASAKILHVDDNAANRYAVSRSLRKAGFEVIEGATGRDALEMIRSRPDLVILDVRLPDISGFEVCRRIKTSADARVAATPVLHLSASFVTSQDKAHGLEIGADAYLVRPVEPVELVATVNALLRARRSEEALRQSEERRRAVMDALVSGEDEQLRRIAGELHDDTIQVMTAALIAIDQLVGSLERGRGDAALRAARRTRETLAEATERTRRLTFELRPQVLQAQGLAAAVRALARLAAREAGFHYSVRVDLGRHAHAVETVAYRTVAEALSNARRHAEPTRVSVRLRERNGEILGEVTDDGHGFDPAGEGWRTRVSLHFGLQQAAERVRLAGGELDVESAPGAGTRVSFRLPA